MGVVDVIHLLKKMFKMHEHVNLIDTIYGYRWVELSIKHYPIGFYHYLSDQIFNNEYRYIIRSPCSINLCPLGFSFKSIFEFTCAYDMQPGSRTSIPHHQHQLFNSVIISWISQLIYICIRGIIQCITQKLILINRT